LKEISAKVKERFWEMQCRLFGSGGVSHSFNSSDSNANTSGTQPNPIRSESNRNRDNDEGDE